MNFNLKNLLYYIYPKKCPFCKTVIDRNLFLCSDCAKSIKSHKYEAIIEIADLDKEIICLSPFAYDGKIRQAICDYKFKGITDYSDFFSIKISEIIKGTLKKVDFITSVPLHKLRQKERGFNQSEIIASKVGKILGIQYKELLVKIKKNKIQHELSGSERSQNVLGVYKSTNEKFIEGKSIILCDDILTTGNTLKECAKMLLKSGAKEIYCVTVATAKKVTY